MDADIKEIKADVKQLLVQSAVHNQILMEHKNFSIALQSEQKLQRAEIKPLVHHVHVVNGLAKGIIAILVGLAINYLAKKYI